MPMMQKLTGAALVLLVALALVSGCLGEEAAEPEEVPEPEPVFEGEKKSSAVIDHDYELPELIRRPDFIEDETGLDSRVLVSTGSMWATLTPEGEFLNLLQAEEIYGDYPVPSPDGRRFVAYGDLEGWNVPWRFLFLGDLQTGEIEEVLYDPGVFYDYPATWSPDGNKIILTGIENRDNWKVNIYYVDFEARTSGVFLDVEELGFYDNAVESCAMHPFKNILYIIGWQVGADRYGLYAYDLDQENLERVAFLYENYAYHVAVSPDGSLLAVTAGDGISEERLETFGLYLIDAATGDQELLFWEEGLQAVMSTFSPDGTELLICTDTRIIDNTWTIYRCDLISGRGEVWIRQKYDSGFDPFSPGWTVIPR